MIQALFLWFYRLPVPAAVLAAVAVTAAFSVLRSRYGSRAFWKKAVWGAAVLWICVVLVMTMWDRPAGTVRSEPLLVPFHSYGEVLRGATREILRSNFMNVMLFYPVGLLLGSVLPRHRVILAATVTMLISTGIELCQYRYGLGIAEIDDVLHNTFGAVLGAVMCALPVRCHKR